MSGAGAERALPAARPALAGGGRLGGRPRRASSAWAIWPRAARPRSTSPEAAIVARLVRLGEPRPKELLPRKEAAAAPGPRRPPPPRSSPPPATPAAPAPRPGRPRRAPATPAPADGPAAPRPGRGGSPASSRGMKQERRRGRPRRRPAGRLRGEGDQYLAQVVRALRRSYGVPSTIGEQERLYLRRTSSSSSSPTAACSGTSS